MKNIYLTIICIIYFVEEPSLVIVKDKVGLDPALFLGPSPPMLPTSHTVSPQERWHSVSNEHMPKMLRETQVTSNDDEEFMENAETFWPSLRANYYGIRVVPLSFSDSGTYGKYSNNSPGVVATSYISVTPENSDIPTKYKNSGLAGSSYGTYRTGQSGIRVFSGGAKSGWSGWGNGKWGHYGKG